MATHSETHSHLLRPWQIETVNQLRSILGAHQSAVDLSDTGTGKTFVAAAVAAMLQVPTLVVCPKIVVSAWHRAATHFNDNLSVINYEKLRTGDTEFGRWEHPYFRDEMRRQNYFVCQCCQQTVDIANSTHCRNHPLGIHCIQTKKRVHRYGKFIFSSEIKFLIFDEVHRCGCMSSLNSEMLIAAKRQGIRTLALSATAACNPLNFRALGYLLDLHGDKVDRFIGPPRCSGGRCQRDMLPNYYRWINRLGCRRDPTFHGWRWEVGAERQIEIMKEIRNQIIPARGVRIRVADIPGFPECSITPELYDVDDVNQLNKYYEEMRRALALLHGRSKLDKSPESAITQMLRARQQIELLKVPVAAELATDDLSKGYSSVIFVNFRQTFDELARRLPGSAVIYGGQSNLAREGNIAIFQSNEARNIVVMADAGGVGLGLHDLHGNHPRIANVMPNFSAVSMKQIFGRLPRDGGKSRCHYRVLLAANTIETRIHRAVTAKLNNLDALNDGDMNPFE